MKAVKYKLVHQSNVEDLNSEVTSLLVAGWDLYGPPVLMDNGFISQAVVWNKNEDQ